MFKKHSVNVKLVRDDEGSPNSPQDAYTEIVTLQAKAAVVKDVVTHVAETAVKATVIIVAAAAAYSLLNKTLDSITD